MNNLSRDMTENREPGKNLRTILFGKRRQLMKTESNESRDFVEAINAAKEDLDNVEKLFNSTSDPDLIEYAIYLEYAAKLKLSYLIKKAKEKEIRLTDLMTY